MPFLGVQPSKGLVGTAGIDADAVTLAKLAAGTDGNIISYDASGDPVAISTGGAGHVLTSAGAGAQPSFKTGGGATNTDTSNTGSVTLDFTTYQNHILTFTGNVTLANPSTESIGLVGIIVIIQDGTGSRTLSLGTDYETAGGAGITISTGANAVDVIPYFVKASGSIQLGAPQLAFA
tara:strand:+ start:1005 stop:1538 length:534 start_codon:yes stop_codon:yes gene_type:complete